MLPSLTYSYFVMKFLSMSASFSCNIFVSLVTTECRRNDRFRKSSVDTKTSGIKFYGKGMYRLRMSPLNYLLIAKGKNINFAGNKSGRYCINQVIKANITNTGISWHHMSVDITHCGGHNMWSDKMHESNKEVLSQTHRR